MTTEAVLESESLDLAFRKNDEKSKTARLTQRQCRCKGNISEGGGGGRGGEGTRTLEARAARGVWGHAPAENFEI